MSFTRTKYDSCEYKTELKESRGPGSYQLNTPQTKSRLPVDPNIQAQRGSVSQRRFTRHRYYDGPVDVESDLKNITRPESRCPSQQFQGDRTPDINVDEALAYFTVEDTRLSNPPITLRGAEIPRWEWPMHNPQAQIFMPGAVEIQSRLVMRDNHRPFVPTPRINSMNPSL